MVAFAQQSRELPPLDYISGYFADDVVKTGL